jgi:hypothetical protein
MEKHRFIRDKRAQSTFDIFQQDKGNEVWQSSLQLKKIRNPFRGLCIAMMFFSSFTALKLMEGNCATRRARFLLPLLPFIIHDLVYVIL